jgi:hypothetical protein
MSWLTVTTCTLPSPATLSSVGISPTHGPHQVAHRFTSTGLPLKLAIVSARPAGPAKSTAGAGAPL